MRLLIVANIDKPHVRPYLQELLPWLKQRVTVVGIDENCRQDWREDYSADAILVLGGDGTLLAVARKLAGQQIPVMGVNFGRLGFLADFTPEQFRASFEIFVRGGLPISRRSMLEASVLPAEVHCKWSDLDTVIAERRFVATALNDAVVTAGGPRMIQLDIGTDSESGISYSGDGVIISTASGSTAYNVSAGGPIISPNVDALCITPICPHSLSFRPVVISTSSTVLISARRVNFGTTLSCDGQVNTALAAGERIVIRRSENQVLLVDNPDTKEWNTLAEKLHWAVGPQYNDGK